MNQRFITVCACLVFIFSCASYPKTEPGWVTDPYGKYNRQAYVAAVGSGINRQAAEKSAFGNLAAYFGQSVSVDESVFTVYREAVKNGITAGWTEQTSVNNEIITTASMDTLIGAEIGDVWHDGKGAYYACAIMNISKAILIYNDLIDSNLRIIDNLLNIPSSQKNSFEGFARYNSAAAIADVNQNYAKILSVISLGAFQNLKRGAEYRLEARGIAQNFPVGIRVKNDRQNRVQSAFAKSLSDLGMVSGGLNSRYIIDVDVAITPVNAPNAAFTFVRMELNANFTDTAGNTILFPYSFSERDGHTSLESATDRVFLTAERKIDSEYKKIIEDYFKNILQ